MTKKSADNIFYFRAGYKKYIDLIAKLGLGGFQITVIFLAFLSLVVYMSQSCVIIARLVTTALHHVQSVMIK